MSSTFLALGSEDAYTVKPAIVGNQLCRPISNLPQLIEHCDCQPCKPDRFHFGIKLVRPLCNVAWGATSLLVEEMERICDKLGPGIHDIGWAMRLHGISGKQAERLSEGYWLTFTASCTSQGPRRH